MVAISARTTCAGKPGPCVVKVKVMLLLKRTALNRLQVFCANCDPSYKTYMAVSNDNADGPGMGKSFSNVSKLDGAVRAAVRHFDQLYGDAYVQSLQD